MLDSEDDMLVLILSNIVICPITYSVKYKTRSGNHRTTKLQIKLPRSPPQVIPEHVKQEEPEMENFSSELESEAMSLKCFPPTFQHAVSPSELRGFTGVSALCFPHSQVFWA